MDGVSTVPFVSSCLRYRCPGLPALWRTTAHIWLQANSVLGTTDELPYVGE